MYYQSVGFLEDSPDLMRINCPHCEQKCVITGHNKFSESVRDIYSQCTSDDCGWKGVMTLSHKSDIRPPRQHFKTMMAELLAGMDPAERNAIFSEAGISS